MLETKHRFSLLTLFAVTGFAAIGCAALRYASESIAGMVMALTATVPFVAVFAALSKPRIRHLASGFSTCTWAFWVFAFATPMQQPVPSEWLDPIYFALRRVSSPVLADDKSTLFLWFRSDSIIVNGDTVPWDEVVRRVRRTLSESEATQVRYYWDPELDGQRIDSVLDVARKFGATSMDGTMTQAMPPRDPFDRVAHCLIALFSGGVGAAVAATCGACRTLRQRNRKSSGAIGR